jgi:2-methylcitrate dehydratase PrpD
MDPGADGRSPESQLASWVAGLARRDLAEPIADRVKLLLLDAIASALAGRSTVDAPAMESAARAFAGDGPSSVIGGGTLSLAGACLVNGYQITAATVCDVHRPTLCHVTPVVVPPALAVAETRDRSGGELIAALAAGLETTVRVGLAMGYPAFRARGWHSPGVVGPLGAAAAVASLLRLGPDAARDAIGLAGSQASGTFAGLGTAQVKFHQARGAVSGLLAGLVAEAGFDGAPRILTAPDGGLFTTYAEGGDPARLTDGLGEGWELLEISLRRWPAASSLQAVVQASLSLLATGDAQPGRVRSIRVRLPEGSYRLNGEATWDDQLGAFQSARYVAAVVLHDRRCWLDQFAVARLADPALDQFARERVTVEIDPALSPSGAAVTYEAPDGSRRTEVVAAPLGAPSAPLGWDEVVAKLGEATAGGAMAGRAGAIVEAVAGLDAAPSISALTKALRNPGRPPVHRGAPAPGGTRGPSAGSRSRPSRPG